VDKASGFFIYRKDIMRVVVTGASGHLGANLVRVLLAEGHSVRALIREDRRAMDGLDVEMTQGDVLDPSSLQHAFRGAEIVYHSAAAISLLLSDDKLMNAVNVEGVRNVVSACQACGVHRLVHFSSIHALEQKPYHQPVDEDRPLSISLQSMPYNRSKAAGEMIVREAVQAGLDAVILNPTGIIGPHDFKPSHFGDVLLALVQQRLPALIQAGFDWVDVRDVARAAVTAAVSAPAGARYLVSGHWVGLTEIAAQIEAKTDKRAPRLVVPLWLAKWGLPFAGLVRGKNNRPLFTTVSLDALHDNPNVSSQRARQALNYIPRPFSETINDTIDWFAQVGWLS
jgi:dihydroflavonol-4-reductase